MGNLAMLLKDEVVQGATRFLRVLCNVVGIRKCHDPWLMRASCSWCSYFCLWEKKESIFLDLHNLTPNNLQDMWQSFWLFDATQHKVLFYITYPFHFSALVIMINDIFIYIIQTILGIWGFGYMSYGVNTTVLNHLCYKPLA